MRVRPARLSDVAAIRGCYLRSWRAAYAGHLAPDVIDAAIEKRRGFDWACGIGAHNSIVLVAPGAGSAVRGVLQVDERPPSPRVGPEVTMLYVDPEAWGTGVARDLLAGGVSWAAHRGHREVRLRVVEEHGRARRFYEREGWREAADLDPDRNDWARLLWYRLVLDPQGEIAPDDPAR
ncbi:GNAT family N-acetyltransferase [Iamia majanohamensis]|uniref:GNAT family N-acetyltransferase n=1 Tax=Iamia majanohamensis TaxID=467976 RepID=A0AAF0BV88_9ACTN|nr:GNAT family N-acetyltransferase [Iamia majanohamensis]WCO68617.1 GNAT family N-acetyltransferase [Iamia majanohamensis]